MPRSTGMDLVIRVTVGTDGAVIGQPTVPDALSGGQSTTLTRAEDDAKAAVAACAPYTVPSGAARTYDLHFGRGYNS